MPRAWTILLTMSGKNPEGLPRTLRETINHSIRGRF